MTPRLTDIGMKTIKLPQPGEIRVLLDMDDVLCDWAGATVELMGMNMKNETVRHAVEETWGLGDLLNPGRMWDMIHGCGEDFWADLKPLPWFELLWSELNRRWPVTLLTSPSSHPSCLAGKKRWLDKHIGHCKFLMGQQKELCANLDSVLVDDKPKNIENFVKFGGHGYLWPNAQKMKRLSAEGKIGCADIVKSVVDYIGEIKEVYPKHASHCEYVFGDDEPRLNL